MIKEKSSYADDLPVNIRIVEIDEYPLHFHQDIEFVIVLKGEINLKCGYFTYSITEGSVFTINGREVHGLYRSDQENIVAMIQIDNYYFSHYFNRLSGSCFRTFTNDKGDERLDTLRYYFVNILLENLKKEPGYKRQIIDLVVRLLAYLDEFFHYFSFENKVVVNTRNDNPVSVERLGRIINYIYEKHAEKLTLEDLGSMEHLSTYYISHLITEGTGMNFREFLCFARVEFSEMLLLDTNKKINVIAQEVGFSATWKDLSEL
jgi:AraC-like DNA-binding protein